MTGPGFQAHHYTAQFAACVQALNADDFIYCLVRWKRLDASAALWFDPSMPRKPKDPRELAARALCRFNGVPEDTQFEGKPMWMSYLDEVDVVLNAAKSADKDRPPS